MRRKYLKCIRIAINEDLILHLRSPPIKPNKNNTGRRCFKPDIKMKYITKQEKN